MLNSSDRVRRALRTFAAVPCLCCVGTVAWAQAMVPPRDAGSILREIKEQPEGRTTTLAAPDLVLPREQQFVTVGGPKVDVRQFRVDGVDASTAQSLQPSLTAFTGSGKTLGDLEAAASAAQAELRKRGRFLAQVVVPAQRLSDGVVDLQVFEGRLGEVRVGVKLDAHISRSLIDSTIEPLQGNPLIERDLVDGALLRLGDLRGIAVNSALKPGDEPGIADLAIEVARGRRYAAEIEYDNGGSVYTGRNRFEANLDLFDLAGRGDVTSLRAQVSSGTRYVQGSWLVPINGLGTRVGPVAGWLSYDLGTEAFKPLDAQGDASWFALQLQQPLIRSQDQNLYLQASIGARRFEDEVRALGVDEDKHVDDYSSIGLFGELRDAYKGLNSYSITVSSGRLGLDDEQAAEADDQSYRTAGRYVVYALELSRLQTLTSRDSLLVATHAQFASRNLDSSEKFTIGGMEGVRGYPDSDSASDQAVILTWEYRRLLGLTVNGQWTASLFGDYGFGRLHETPLANDADNTRDLHSHGVGLDYATDAGLSIRSFVAWRGNTPAQSDDRGAQVLVQASLSF